jgi:hypothetical protein
LYLVFRGVEGVTATHIFYRIYQFVREGSLETTVTKRARHLPVAFFVLALGAYLILDGLAGRPVIGSVRYDLTAVYTVT